MLGVFMVFFNLIIFVFVAGIITKNVMNIKNVTDRFKNIYQNEGEEGIYNHIKENYNNVRTNNGIKDASFDSTMQSNNNPIKEKRGKRSNI